MKITRIQNTAISGRIAGSRPKAELAAARFVRRMGIRPNLTGDRYLITAIELGLRCPQLTESMTYRMYPNVAEYYGANRAQLSAISARRSSRHMTTTRSVFGISFTTASEGRPSQR